MAETLVGVRPSSIEDLMEEPALAEAAVRGPAPECLVPAEPAEPSAAELAIARDLVRSARAWEVAMTGPNGMFRR